MFFICSPPQYRSALVIFRKPTRSSLTLRKAQPLISVFSPQERGRKPPFVLYLPHLSLPSGRGFILNQAFPLTIKGKDVTALQCYICPTCPSPAEGSLILYQAFPLTIKGKDVTALLGARNRYALRLADHQRSSPYGAGWDRLEKKLST